MVKQILALIFAFVLAAFILPAPQACAETGLAGITFLPRESEPQPESSQPEPSQPDPIPPPEQPRPDPGGNGRPGTGPVTGGFYDWEEGAPSASRRPLPDDVGGEQSEESWYHVAPPFTGGGPPLLALGILLLCLLILLWLTLITATGKNNGKRQRHKCCMQSRFCMPTIPVIYRDCYNQKHSEGE